MVKVQEYLQADVSIEGFTPPSISMQGDKIRLDTSGGM
jgi:hypothetical protein